MEYTTYQSKNSIRLGYQIHIRLDANMGNLVSNRFSHHFTYESCLESCSFNYMLSKYKSDDESQFDGRTISNQSQKECMEVAIKAVVKHAESICSCKRACNETIYSAKEKYLSVSRSPPWRLYFYNVDAVTDVAFFPDFPGEQFLGTFGGVLGLGGKFQVIFQAFVFFFLCIGSLFVRNRWKQNVRSKVLKNIYQDSSIPTYWNWNSHLTRARL